MPAVTRAVTWPFLVLLSGIMSVGYFLSGTRRWKWMLLGLIALQVAVTYGTIPYFPSPRTPLGFQAMRARLILDGAGFEVRGRAAPASRVGGDLVDAVVVDGTLTAYVADVSGHGVPAGTLMAGLKSAARMRLRAPATIVQLLGDLNAMLMEIKRPNMFATVACLRLTPGKEVTYALAGHLPVLHRHRSSGAVDELANGQMALGILAGQTYSESAVAIEEGDLLALVTDGLTEVENGKGREMGLEGVAAVLRARGDGPLEALLDAILEAARAHGPQRDDQSVLLVRVGRRAGDNMRAACDAS